MRLRPSRHYCIALSLFAILMPSCAQRGRFEILGYQFGSMHNECYRTIYVPIFENRAFQSGPLRGLEYSLTEEVQREIEKTTPWKVVHDRGRADTELLGVIVLTPKNIINRNQLNEIREGEMII